MSVRAAGKMANFFILLHMMDAKYICIVRFRGLRRVDGRILSIFRHSEFRVLRLQYTVL